MIINNQNIAYKLPLQASIFTAEAMAIYKAVKYIHIEYANHQTKYITLGDSLGNLIAITNTRNQPYITKLIQEESFLAEKKNKHICFVWIPGHIGIQIVTINAITFADTKNQINLHLNSKWHSHWCKFNTKLNKIKNDINIWKNLELNSKEETIIYRLRIGYTHLTHSYLMSKDEPLLCYSFLRHSFNRQPHHHRMSQIQPVSKPIPHLQTNLSITWTKPIGRKKLNFIIKKNRIL